MSEYDTAAAVTSAFVAGLALFLSISDGLASRRHARLSVKPMLTEDVRIAPNVDRIGVYVRNAGLGPACIRSWTLLVDGKPYGEIGINNWEELTTYLGINERVTYGYFLDGGAIVVGESVEMFGISAEGYTPAKAKMLRKALRRLTIRLKYQSMYENEKYMFEFIGDRYFKDEA